MRQRKGKKEPTYNPESHPASSQTPFPFTNFFQGVGRIMKTEICLMFLTRRKLIGVHHNDPAISNNVIRAGLRGFKGAQN